MGHLSRGHLSRGPLSGGRTWPGRPNVMLLSHRADSIQFHTVTHEDKVLNLAARSMLLRNIFLCMVTSHGQHRPAKTLPPNSLPPNMAATNLHWSEVPLVYYDTTYLLSNYVQIPTYTIIHQRHSTEIAGIWKGKLIGGYMITRCSAIAERPRCSMRYSFRQK